MTESISEKLSFMRDIAQEFILKVLFPLLEKADLYTEFMRSASRLSIRWLRDVEQTTPAAPVKGTEPFYLMARPPLLDQGGEFALPSRRIDLRCSVSLPSEVCVTSLHCSWLYPRNSIKDSRCS